MITVEVEFPGEFSGAGPVPIPIGRILLGGRYEMRIVFHPDGTVKAHVDPGAIADGALVVAVREDAAPVGFVAPKDSA